MVMRIVLGVDLFERARGAVALTGALKFKEATVEILNVVERVGGIGWEMLPNDRLEVVDRILKNQELEARESLVKAIHEFEKYHIKARSELIAGFSATKQIMAHADQVDADLIVVGSQSKSPLEGLMTGSVGRKLALGARQSLLVVKGDAVPDGPLTVVFATDHSEYARGCVDKILQFAPAGIERFIVLSAFPKNLISTARSVMENFSIDVSGWVEDSLRENNDAVIEKLRPLGWRFESIVKAAPVNDAIKQTMRESDAHLLICGAHGHGYFERMILGSVALHQVVGEPHSVLLLRD